MSELVPFFFQTTENLKPIGKPLITIEPIDLKFPISLFRKEKDNEITHLRRILLFFKGLCDTLCSFSLPINCFLKSNFEIKLGSIQMEKRWPFIPTKDLWQDLEKELEILPIKLSKDRYLIYSLMWLGHRLESKSKIQSFLDSYRIIENLANREIELMLKDVNLFIKNNPRWKNYCQGNKPLELDLKEGNFVKNFLISRWNISEKQWSQIKEFRDAIVHGETPDVEFKDDFQKILPVMDNLTNDILANEIKSILNTNILLSRKEIYVTETNDGKFVLKPLHECLKTVSGTEYILECLSEEKFERLVSTLNSTEADELRNYLKYHSHDLLVKNVPSHIKQGKSITIQNHDYGSSFTISPEDSKP